MSDESHKKINMKKLCLIAIAMTAFSVVIYQLLMDDPEVVPREMGLPAKNEDSARLVSRKVVRNRDANDAAKALSAPKRKEGYFQDMILKLENDKKMGSRLRSEHISGILYAWALSNPDEALKYMRSTFNKDPYAYELFVPAVLSAWSKIDPRASLEYVVNNPDSIPLSLDMVRASLTSAVKYDGNIILEHSAKMPGDWISSVSRDLKEYFSKNGQDLLLLNHVSNLPPHSEQKRAFLIGFADAYAAGGDWESGWKVVSELVHMADDEKMACSVAKTFSLTASWSDPVGFMKWVNDNVSEEQGKDLFVETAASDWARRDIVSYSGWVRNLPVEERDDKLIINIIEPILLDDPVGALEWSSQMQNPKVKEAYYSKILDHIDFGVHSKELKRLIDQGVLPSELYKSDSGQ